MLEYPKISRFGSREYLNFLAHIYAESDSEWFITVSEKLDGANASIEKLEDGSLKVYSRNKELDEHNTLRGFYNEIMGNQERYSANIKEGEIIYGEWLVPHIVEYPDKMYKKFYPFEFYDKNEDIYAPTGNTFIENGLYFSFLKRCPSKEELQEIIDQISKEREIEGLVVTFWEEFFIDSKEREVYRFKYINPKIENKFQTKNKPNAAKYSEEKEKLKKEISVKSIIKSALKLVDMGELKGDELEVENLGKIIPIVKKFHLEDLKEEKPYLFKEYNKRTISKVIEEIIVHIIKNYMISDL